MNILISGAGGFVGRQLVKTLIDVGGHDLVVLDTDLNGIADQASVTKLPGDLADADLRRRALGDGVDAIIHLATVPGGAAEADYAASRRINLDAGLDLFEAAAALKPGVRVVFASSIAVFGDPLPDHVDDATPLAPAMTYGAHKLMTEIALADLSRKGRVDAVSVRLPGILARPAAASGMKSAFMSDLFHALKAGRAFTCPVSLQGTVWAMSLSRIAENLAHALTVESRLLPAGRAVTLPALRISMGDLAREIAAQTGVDADALVSVNADAALEAAFAHQPPLLTPAAECAGFRHDGDLATLVRAALATLES